MPKPREKRPALRSDKIDLKALRSDELLILKFLAKKRGKKKFPIFSVREIEEALFGENDTTTLTRNGLRRIARTKLVERPKHVTGSYRATQKALDHLKKLK